MVVVVVAGVVGVEATDCRTGYCCDVFSGMMERCFASLRRRGRECFDQNDVGRFPLVIIVRLVDYSDVRMG